MSRRASPGNRRPDRRGGDPRVAILAVGIVAVGTLVLGRRLLRPPDDRRRPSGRRGAGDVRRLGRDASSSSPWSWRSLAAVLVSAVLWAPDRAAAPGGRGGRPGGSPPATTRLASPDEGPEELASLADSFNQMAAALEEQERLRREFIANAAHELRTPLTNLQGYLEALRDEVIPADRATFESLWDEAERLVRLSRSLDVLAEGDASPATGRRWWQSTWRRPFAAAAELVAPAMAAAGLACRPGRTARPGRAGRSRRARAGAGQPAAERAAVHPTGRLGAGDRRGGPGRRRSSPSSNTGPGIPPDDLPHVFERFYRVEKSRDAARAAPGIGLAIVARSWIRSAAASVPSRPTA